MSSLSPILMPSRFFLFSILRVTVRPSAVVTVMDGTDGLIAFTDTVVVTCAATVALGDFPDPGVTAPPTVDGLGAVPGGCTVTTADSMYVMLMRSPTLSSLN